MWIEHNRFHDDGRPKLKALKLPEMDEKVEFSSNGKSQVTSDVADLLTERVESIEQIDSGESSKEGDTDVNE